MTASLLQDDSSLRILLTSARRIAVVGLSDKPHRDSAHVARYLVEQGYVVLPVNPMLASWRGLEAYPDLDSVPGPVDIVDIFRRPFFVPSIVDAAIRIGARAVWMQLGVIHAPAAAHAAEAGLKVVMDRCILIEHRRLMGQTDR